MTLTPAKSSKRKWQHQPNVPDPIEIYFLLVPQQLRMAVVVEMYERNVLS